ncbi:MAG: DUF2231 domain-containing protein [Calditrichia bacterium]|nr:hypothetical protein [Calditrichota bacterium]MCB0285637.1 hypothetical protein [Calditrichota bacterium]MCB9067187.1 hypothetical protein [Calditrichia bacterium]
MSFLPEWAPNAHPLIVHFPIAILLLAVFFDVLSTVFRKHSWLSNCASSLYSLGALGAIVAYFSGKQAADLANIPAIAHSTLSEHADYGFYTAWFFGLFGLFRLLGLWKQWFQHIAVHIASLIIALAGAFLLFQTAEHGAELVFRHGVGVKAAEETRRSEAEQKTAEKTLQKNGIVKSEDGSWEWYPGQGANTVLAHQFKWWLGNISTLNAKTASSQSGKEVLSLHPQNMRVLFTAGKSLQGIQVDVRVNLDDFSGNFMIVHHVQDLQNFDFIKLADGEIQLGRMVNGNEKIEDRDVVTIVGWIRIRSVGQGGHFRGYVNEKLLTHGHAKDLPPGPVGLLIDGSGVILIDEMAVQSIN